MAQKNKNFNVCNIAKWLKSSVKELMNGSEAVYFYRLRVDEFGRDWCIVLGWNNGFDKTDTDTSYVCEEYPEYHICAKIAYNDSMLQSDYQFDWLQPWDNETGDVDDDDSDIPQCTTEKDWRKLALMLKRNAYRKVRDWEHTLCK